MSSFFIPIIAFAVWAGAVFSYLSVFRLGLPLSDTLLAFLFFISLLVLVLALALSGPVAAAVLGILSTVASVYLCLSIKEPAIFLQIVVYGVLFFFMLSYLQIREKQANDKGLLREKLFEEINMARKELSKKEILGAALAKKTERFLDLHRFTGELKVKRSLEETADKIVQEVRQALGKSEECVLYLVDEAREGLSLVAASRLDAEIVKEKAGSLFDQWVMKKSQGLLVEDTQSDFRFSVEAKSRLERLRSVCVSPLMTENKVLGVIRTSATKPGVFNADDLRLLDIFASLAAVNLRNILLYDKMEELAIKDGLTGLFLNRYFQGRLTEEIQRARARKFPFAMILLDIDFFKRYNDEYGHAAGDIVLKNVASVLVRSLDKTDLVARYGGEEFIILLPNKDHAAVLRVAEHIRAEIERSKFLFRRIEGRVTASLGVTAFPKDGHTEAELLSRVDKNLYEAKRSGRNRVCGSI